MTNQISKIGLPDGVQSVDVTQKTAPAEPIQDPTFDAILDTQSVDAIHDPALHNAINTIAQSIKSGELADPTSAVPAVIDAIIDLRFSDVPTSTRASMAADIREALAQDPFFSLEIEALIARALIR